MEYINGYSITNNSASSKQRASVIVRNSSGQVCARVYADSGKLLQRIRRELHSPERAELIEQLTKVNVPQEDIAAIVAMQVKNK